jgi:hypothetical protein
MTYFAAARVRDQARDGGLPDDISARTRHQLVEVAIRRASRPNSSMLMRIECTGFRRSQQLANDLSLVLLLHTAQDGGVG